MWVRVQVADAQAQAGKETRCRLELVTAAEVDRKCWNAQQAVGLGLGPGSTTTRLHHYLQCHVAAAVEGRGVARWW